MSRRIEITHTDDPRLDLYRNVKDRDLTGREGLFMAEGQVVLERLFSSPLCETISVLTTPERLLNLDVSAVGDAPVYVVAQDMMDKVAGFPIPEVLQGINAVISLSDVMRRRNWTRC